MSLNAEVDKSDELDWPLINLLRQLESEKKFSQYSNLIHQALTEVKIIDCGEPLIDLDSALDSRVIINLVDLGLPVSYEARAKLRQGIIEKINLAQAALGSNYRLMIRDAYRDAATVWHLFEKYVQVRLSRGLNRIQAESEVRNILALPDNPVPPGHMTGAAVDIVLADASGHRVHLELPENVMDRSVQMYTACAGLPLEIVKRRQILLEAMTAAGFHNYFKEYWHFSFGEAYWAVRRLEKMAIYGLV